jgi:hypothetical protein
MNFYPNSDGPTHCCCLLGILQTGVWQKLQDRPKEASEDLLKSGGQKLSKAYGQGQENVKPAGGSALTIAASLAADPWSLFLFAMKSPMTREKYRAGLPSSLILSV